MDFSSNSRFSSDLLYKFHSNTINPFSSSRLFHEYDFSCLLYCEKERIFPWNHHIVYTFCSNLSNYLLCSRKGRGIIPNKYHIVDYITRYDRFFITMSVLSGFYSSVQITNSKLFHRRRLSMQLSHKQMAAVYNLHLINDIILEVKVVNTSLF